MNNQKAFIVDKTKAKKFLKENKDGYKKFIERYNKHHKKGEQIGRK